VEDKITEFEKALRATQTARIHKTNKINLCNLMLPQLQTMQQLKMNKSFIIKPTDKNLGPAILDPETYVSKILSEHLLTKDYQHLTGTEATTAMATIKTKLKNIIDNNHLMLSKSEATYFQRSLQVRHRWPLFYGLPKVHKNPFYVTTSGKRHQRTFDSVFNLARLQNERALTICSVLHQELIHGNRRLSQHGNSREC
jgi:hypothetical protein